MASLSLTAWVKTQRLTFYYKILRKLWYIEYFAHLAQTAILFFAYQYMTEQGAQGCWSGTFLILVYMICQVHVNTRSLISFP